MTLRNAFDELGTESALRRIANLLTFARDANDRIRVSLDNGPMVSVYARNAGGVMYGSDSTPYYGAHGWNAIDAREQTSRQYRLNMIQTRQTRWTF